MKRMKFTLLLLGMLLMSHTLAARTIEVKVSQCGKPLVDNLNNVAKTLNGRDCLIINLDKPGKYEIDGTFQSKCNTTIKGISPSATQIILKEGFKNGRTKLVDDSFIKIYGTEFHKIKVDIKNVAFKLADHKGILWEDSPKHIVKIYHSNGLVVDNVEMYSCDAAITSLDLRNCSNTLIQNSTFENYNNCMLGGCLWSRGSQENVVVKNNVFWKYGNDEALAIWGSSYSNNMKIKNVTIDGNSFYYENKKKCKKNISIDVLINFSHHEGSDVKQKCYIDSILFKNNIVTINGQSKRSILLNFDDLAILGKIEISENTFQNKSRCQVSDGYMTDINVNTGSNYRGDIIINDNNVYNEAEILCNGKNTGYTFLGVKNGVINLSNNYIQSDYPIALMKGGGGSISLNLYKNVVSILSNVAILSDANKLEKVVINASGNEFTGDTRIYCRNIDNLELNFTNNTFNSNNYHIFLQEAAPTTSVIFDGNTINALAGKGTLFANYTGTAYKFKDVRVSNNIFRGVSKKELENSFVKVSKKNFSNNIYR